MTLQELMRRVECLPPLSNTAVRVMGLIGDPASSLQDIVKALRYDPALTGQMLKLCNSAAFGMVRRIASVDEALVYLGRSRVLGIITMLNASGVLGQSQEGYGLEPRMLWRHSVAVALSSEWFSQRIECAQRTWAFTAGLLHDIGKIVLNEFVTGAFDEITVCVKAGRVPFDEAERRILGYSSSEAGVALAEHWRLPEPIVRCIRHHLDPTVLSDPDDLVDCVHLANCVSMMMGVGVGDDGLCYRAEVAVTMRHGLEDNDMETCGLYMISLLKDIEGELQSPSPPSLAGAGAPKPATSAGARA